MNPISLPKPLRGIVPPLVTPLAGQDALDRGGVERLVEHVLRGGVHGLFIMGTSGEGPSLSGRLRRELITLVCRQAEGRVPVLVGITDTSFVESVSLAFLAKEAGAQAVVYPGPCYYPMSQAELLKHLERLCLELPLPLYLYNMPSHTKVSFDVQTIHSAADLPQVVGMKDSSGDLNYFRALCRVMADHPDFALLMGPEELLTGALAAGGHGGVCGGANLCPELFVALYNALLEQRTDDAASLQQSVDRLGHAIYPPGPHAPYFLKGLKCALSIKSLCSDLMAEPLSALTGSGRDAIFRSLEDLGCLEPRNTRKPLRP